MSNSLDSKRLRGRNCKQLSLIGDYVQKSTTTCRVAGGYENSKRISQGPLGTIDSFHATMESRSLILLTTIRCQPKLFRCSQ